MGYEARWKQLRKTLEVATKSKAGDKKDYDTTTVFQVLFVMDALEDRFKTKH